MDDIIEFFFNCGKIVAALFAVLAFALYYFQNKLLYMPLIPNQPYKVPEDNPPGLRSPSERGIPYDDIWLTTDDGQELNAWFMKQPQQQTAPTLIYFQANAGNMGLRLENLALLYKTCDMNVFVISYRGYGKSTGTPTEAGLMSDARATLDYVFNELDIDKNKVFIFGRSLGGAVAIYAAGLGHPVRGMILENTFTCIGDMVHAIMPKIAWLKFLVLAIDWPSETRIASVPCPIMMISGGSDELVPPHHMERLRDRATTEVEWFRVENGDHNSTWRAAGWQYWSKIADFIIKNTAAN